jgi:hypothetical protein
MNDEDSLKNAEELGNSLALQAAMEGLNNSEFIQLLEENEITGNEQELIHFYGDVREMLKNSMFF